MLYIQPRKSLEQGQHLPSFQDPVVPPNSLRLIEVNSQAGAQSMD